MVILSIEKAFDALQTRLNDSSTDEIEMLEVIQVRMHTITINQCNITVHRDVQRVATIPETVGAKKIIVQDRP